MEPTARADVWERWAWLWAALFYGTVVGSVVLALLDENNTTPAWVVVGVSALLIVWHAGGLLLLDRSRRPWPDLALARFVVIVGDAVLWFILVSASPAFYLALFALFAQAFRHLPIPYAATAAALLTAGTIVEQVSDDAQLSPSSPTIWLSIAAGIVAIAMGSWVWAIIAQSTRRRELIEQLEATRQELAAAERREGVLAERQRLAREIHDTLAQAFVSIILHLEAVEAAEAADPEAEAEAEAGAVDLDTVRTHLHHVSTTARAGLEQARRVVDGLRPSQLDDSTLHDAIERAAQRWSAETGVRVATTITGDALPQPIEIEATLLRVAQEALHNVHTHAEATEVQLTLSYLDDVVILDIHDNGVGLAGAKPSRLSGGFGHESIRQRVAEHGGSFAIESDPGEGTTLAVILPVGQPRATHATTSHESRHEQGTET